MLTHTELTLDHLLRSPAGSADGVQTAQTPKDRCRQQSALIQEPQLSPGRCSKMPSASGRQLPVSVRSCEPLQIQVHRLADRAHIELNPTQPAPLAHLPLRPAVRKPQDSAKTQAACTQQP